MKTKTFQQRIAVEQLAINVDDPFDFHREKFKCMAREIFYEIEEISWRPILDKEKNIIWIEFTATGTVIREKRYGREPWWNENCAPLI